MQRDILMAFWFLFDEFALGEDDNAPDRLAPDASTPSRGLASPAQRSRPQKSDRSA